MELWQKVFHEGVAPCVGQESLTALRRALDQDDNRLVQGRTTIPPPLACALDWPVEAACALGFCHWKGEDGVTVRETDEQVARWCFEIDQTMGEPAAVRHFLNWADSSPRDEMRKALIEEIDLALGRAKEEAVA